MTKGKFLKQLNVFVSSPSDVNAERDKVKEIASKLQKKAHAQGIHIEFLDWRENVVPVLGNPQETTLEQLKLGEADLFIMILWHRFGTETGRIDPSTGRPYRSGTEQEFQLAYKFFKASGRKRPQISVYRCTRPIPPNELDGVQYNNLIEFIKNFQVSGPYEAFLKEYGDLDKFGSMIEDLLSRFLDEESQEPLSISPPSNITPSIALPLPPVEVHDDAPTNVAWDDLDPKWLEAYLKDCRRECPSLQEKKEFLIGQGLLSEDGEHLTRAGAILLCREDKMPHNLCTWVMVYDTKGGETPLFQHRTPAYQLLTEIQDYLKVFAEEGPDGYTPYPWNALVETLVNFIIHRDHTNNDRAIIEIKDDKITFTNPGHSLIDIHSINEAVRNRESILPHLSKYRNPTLVKALSSTRINQVQGRGLTRVVEALVANESYLSNGLLGVNFYSDAARFSVTLYKKLPDSSRRDFENRIKVLSVRNQQIEEEKEKLKKALSDARTDLNRTQDEVSELRQKTSNLEEEITHSRTESDQVRTSYQSSHEENATLKTREADLTRRLGEAQQQLEQLKGEARGVQAELIEARVENENLQQQFASLEQNNRQLQSDIDALTQQNQGLEAQHAAINEKAQTDIQTLKDELQTKIENIQNLESQSLELQTQITDLQEKCQDLLKIQARLDSSEAQNDSLQKTTTELQRHLQELEEQKQTSDKASREVKNEIDEQNRFLRKVKQTNGYYIILLIFSFILLGVFGLNYILDRTTPSALNVDLQVDETYAPHCIDGGMWMAKLVIHSKGGQLPIVYYWNSLVISRTLSTEGIISFSLQQIQGRPIQGTAFAASADGQSAAEEIHIESPDCQ